MKRNRAGKWIALSLLIIWGGAMAAYVVFERRARLGRELIVAAELGNRGEVERLIGAGALTNARNRGGFTALFLAAGNGNTEVIEMLIRRGADPNQRSAYGTTPLMEAARMGRAEAVKALLSGGANPRVEGNNGEMALRMAEEERHADVAAILRRSLNHVK